jgi:hypothetical protein
MGISKRTLLQDTLARHVRFPLTCWLPQCKLNTSGVGCLSALFTKAYKKQAGTPRSSDVCYDMPSNRRWDSGGVSAQECQSGEIHRITQRSSAEGKDGTNLHLQRGRLSRKSYKSVDTRVKCHSCALEMCYECLVPFHRGLTCQAYRNEKRAVEDMVATERLLSVVTKRCPGCKARIWKDGDSPHMRCSLSEFEFCWECLAKYYLTSDNGPDSLPKFIPSMHKKGCRY